jgi:twitching motility protein PilT
MLSTSLRAVLAQQLVRTRTGDERLPAVEVMVNNAAVSNLVREAKTEQLESAIQAGALLGMQTMDAALRRLLEAGRITGEEAYRHAFRRQQFESHLPKGIS